MLKTKYYNNLKILLKIILPSKILNKIKEKHYQNVYKKFQLCLEPDLKIIKEVIKPGQIVVDIGANIGLYTKFLSEFVGLEGKVYSIEPIPETYRFLKKNITFNRYDNVVLFNYAMSDSDKTVAMDIPSVTAGKNYFRARITSEPSEKSYVIKANSLDKLLQDKGNIDFIKCDVEGHEYNVFNGAMNIINGDHPDLLVEIDGNIEDKQSKAYKLYKDLIDKEYTCWIYKNEKLIQWQNGLNSVNYFFLNDNTVNSLKSINLVD